MVCPSPGDFNEASLRRYIRRVLVPPLVDLQLELSSDLAFRRAARLLLERNFPRKFGIRAILKDPVGLFAAPWLVREFNMIGVVLVRHPAAYVVSLIKDSSHIHSFSKVFIEQPNLMEKFSAETSELIECVSKKQNDFKVGYDPVEEGSVFWRCFYEFALIFCETEKGFSFVFYESLAFDPLREFERLCGNLNIEFSSDVVDEIRKTALVKDKHRQSLDTHVKAYDSIKNIGSWKNVLTGEQSRRVREITEPVVQRVGPWPSDIADFVNL